MGRTSFFHVVNRSLFQELTPSWNPKAENEPIRRRLGERGFEAMGTAHAKTQADRALAILLEQKGLSGVNRVQ